MATALVLGARSQSQCNQAIVSFIRHTTAQLRLNVQDDETPTCAILSTGPMLRNAHIIHPNKSNMSEVKITKGSSLQQSGGQTDGMIRMNAITDSSDQICGSRA
jgi:hypothetical protein